MATKSQKNLPSSGTDKKETTISRIVLGSDLNHHGTLFAGQMAKWVVEACLISAAKLHGNAENIVCVNIEQLTFKHPVEKGRIIDIHTHIDRIGKTSLTIGARVTTDILILETAITFVILDDKGNPLIHKLDRKLQ